MGIARDADGRVGSLNRKSNPFLLRLCVGAETFNLRIHHEKNLIVYHTAARDDEQLYQRRNGGVPVLQG